MLQFNYMYYIFERWYIDKIYKCILRPIKLSFIEDDYEFINTTTVIQDIIMYQSILRSD